MVRLKSRYYLCEAVFPDKEHDEVNLTDQAVYHAIRAAVSDYHGEYGLAVLLASLSVKYLNPRTRMTLIRASRLHHKLVATALPFVQKIGKESAFFKTLHVGGTIRSCQKFLAKHHRQYLVQLLRETEDPDLRAKIQGLLLDSKATAASLGSLERIEDEEMDTAE